MPIASISNGTVTCMIRDVLKSERGENGTGEAVLILGIPWRISYHFFDTSLGINLNCECQEENWKCFILSQIRILNQSETDTSSYSEFRTGVLGSKDFLLVRFGLEREELMKYMKNDDIFVEIDVNILEYSGISTSVSPTFTNPDYELITGTITYDFPNVSKMVFNQEQYSDIADVAGYSWKCGIKNAGYLRFLISFNNNPEIFCIAKTTVRLMRKTSSKFEEFYSKTVSNHFNYTSKYEGLTRIVWYELLDSKNGYLMDDTLRVEMIMTIYKENVRK